MIDFASAYPKIEGLLNRQLASVATLPVVYENSGSEEGATTQEPASYIVQSFLPGKPTLMTIGGIQKLHWVGIYKVAVVVPAGTGKGDIDPHVQAILSGYKAGTRISELIVGDRVTVTCLIVYPTAGFKDGGRWRSPVTIEWRVETA